MPALKAKIDGVWVEIGGGGSGAEEVFVGPADPGPSYDLWYDTDASSLAAAYPSDVTPMPTGSALPGISPLYARGDHVHSASAEIQAAIAALPLGVIARVDFLVPVGTTTLAAGGPVVATLANVTMRVGRTYRLTGKFRAMRQSPTPAQTNITFMANGLEAGAQYIPVMSGWCGVSPQALVVGDGTTKTWTLQVNITVSTDVAGGGNTFYIEDLGAAV